MVDESKAENEENVANMVDESKAENEENVVLEAAALCEEAGEVENYSQDLHEDLIENKMYKSDVIQSVQTTKEAGEVMITGEMNEDAT